MFGAANGKCLCEMDHRLVNEVVLAAVRSGKSVAHGHHLEGIMAKITEEFLIANRDIASSVSKLLLVPVGFRDDTFEMGYPDPDEGVITSPEHPYVGTRRNTLVYLATDALICFRGGLGTLSELFVSAEAMQAHRWFTTIFGARKKFPTIRLIDSREDDGRWYFDELLGFIEGGIAKGVITISHGGVLNIEVLRVDLGESSRPMVKHFKSEAELAAYAVR